MDILTSLSAALIGGLLLSRLAKRLALPAVTAYLAAGLLLGPLARLLHRLPGFPLGVGQPLLGLRRRGLPVRLGFGLGLRDRLNRFQCHVFTTFCV